MKDDKGEVGPESWEEDMQIRSNTKAKAQTYQKSPFPKGGTSISKYFENSVEMRLEK